MKKSEKKMEKSEEEEKGGKILVLLGWLKRKIVVWIWSF